MNKKTKIRIIELTILALVLALVLGVKAFDYYTNIKPIESEEWVGAQSGPEGENTTQEALEEIAETITVQVAGAVHKPDVYEVEKGSRVNDVIKLAGGFTEEADQSQINLASKVYDTQKIMVYKVGEAPEIPSETPLGAWTLKDLNEAGLEKLMEIKGVGPSMAGKIIDYRNEHGPFNQIDELLSVSGIGEKKLQTIKEVFESSIKK